MKRVKYVIPVLTIFVDQLVKMLIRNSFEPGESIDVLGRIFALTYLKNYGCAFSLMSGHQTLLIVVTIIVIAFVLIYMAKNPNEHWTMYLALSLAIGGGISNLLDRAVAGYVTDMFDFHFWPVFNVADIAIVTGCILLCIYILFYFDKKETANDSNQHL